MSCNDTYKTLRYYVNNLPKVAIGNSFEIYTNLLLTRSAILGDGQDLVTIKDALRLNPVDNWNRTEESTMYYDNNENKILVCSDIGGTMGWESVVFMSDGGSPQLYVYGIDYPTTRTLWHRSNLLTWCIGKENEDMDKVKISDDRFSKYAFVITNPQGEAVYINDVSLRAGDTRLTPVRIEGGKKENGYLLLRKGERFEVIFPEEEIRNVDSVTLEITGYYEIGENASGLHKALKKLSKKMSLRNRVQTISMKDDNKAENGEIYWTPDGELHTKRKDGKIFRIKLEEIK